VVFGDYFFLYAVLNLSWSATCMKNSLRLSVLRGTARRVLCIVLETFVVLSNVICVDTSLTPRFAHIQTDLRLQKLSLFREVVKTEWKGRGTGVEDVKGP